MYFERFTPLNGNDAQILIHCEPSHSIMCHWQPLTKLTDRSRKLVREDTDQGDTDQGDTDQGVIY